MTAVDHLNRIVGSLRRLILSRLQTAESAKEIIEFKDALSNPPIVDFDTELKFDIDKDLTTVTGGTRTFTIAASGNKNGVAILAKVNAPTAINFPAGSEAMEGSSAVTTTGMNIIIFRYYTNYNGSGTDKVLYVIKNQTAL